MTTHTRATISALAAFALLGCIVQPVHGQATNATLQITIKTVPPAGPGGDADVALIDGTVTRNATPGAKVVVYAYAGDRWWVQPTATEPYTDPGDDGTWSTQTHLGRMYAALFVSSQFKAAAQVRALPAVGGDVLAVARVNGK